MSQHVTHEESYANEIERVESSAEAAFAHWRCMEEDKEGKLLEEHANLMLGQGWGYRYSQGQD